MSLRTQRPPSCATNRLWVSFAYLRTAQAVPK